MAVRLTSPILGLAVGDTYSGPLESWAKNEGYATDAATVPDAWGLDADDILGAEAPEVTVTPTAAVLTGPTDAVNIVTGGNLVVATQGGVTTTVALADADTPAAAATKIDTALAGLADAAIVAGNLQITSTATGPKAYVVIVSGTGTVIANLGVTVGQEAWGSDGRPVGASNVGVQADVPDNDPTDAAHREAPYFPSTPDRHTTIANDATHLTQESLPAPDFDLDLGDVDTEAPSDIVLDPAEGPEEGGTVVTIFGNNLEGVTAVTFDAVAGTDIELDNAGDGIIRVTTPAGTAGAVDVVLDDGSTDTTVTDGFEYLATP